MGQSLVDALLALFPESIDRLTPEKGVSPGPKPVWTAGSQSDEEEWSFSSFLFGESGSGIEFGAEQCESRR